MKTKEELEELLAELKERNRQARLERGLPEESPEPFVGETLSYALYERLLPFRKIAVKYAAIIAEGGAPVIDMTALEDYRKMSELLQESKVFWLRHCGFGIVFRIMDRINEEASSRKYDGPTHKDLALLKFALTEYGNIYYDHESNESYHDRMERIKADVKRMDFDKEYAEALAQYESIKHLI